MTTAKTQAAIKRVRQQVRALAIAAADAQISMGDAGDVMLTSRQKQALGERQPVPFDVLAKTLAAPALSALDELETQLVSPGQIGPSGEEVR